MARATEPQRVIMSGQTRVIGSAPRPKQQAGTVGTRPAAVRAPNAPAVGRQRTPQDERSRVTAGPPREPGAIRPPARRPDAEAPAPGEAAPPRPIERIATLEAKVAELEEAVNFLTSMQTTRPPAPLEGDEAPPDETPTQPEAAGARVAPEAP